MTAGINNVWVDVWIEHLWICWQATDVAARTIDFDLQLGPRALADRCLHPREPRLNPLEFHGKRRSAPPRPSHPRP